MREASSVLSCPSFVFSPFPHFPGFTFSKNSKKMEGDIVKPPSTTNVLNICSGQVASTFATAIKEPAENSSETDATNIDLCRQAEKNKCGSESENTEECLKRKIDTTLSDNQDDTLITPPTKSMCRVDEYSNVVKNEETNNQKSDKNEDHPDSNDIPRELHVSQSSNLHTSVKNLSAIQVGTSDFRELVQKDDFIDRTMLIQYFMKSGCGAILITPPRRSGKTTNLNMIKTFLEVEVDENGNEKTPDAKENYKLFTEEFKGKRLKISYDKEFIKKHLGQYPVIFVSFADVKANSYDEILDEMKVAISAAFRQHKYLYKSYLIESIKEYNEINKENIDTNGDINYLEQIVDTKAIHLSGEAIMFRKYSANSLEESAGETDIMFSLKFLSQVLYKKFKKEVFVLVDEYDTPINSISNSNIKDDHYDGSKFKVDFLTEQVLGSVLKGNRYLAIGLMTGISWYTPNTPCASSLNHLCRCSSLERYFTAL